MKLTMRKSGERMATFTLKFHASEALIDWTAAKLGCSRAGALKAIKAAYDADIGLRLGFRALIFDPDSDDKIQLHDNEEVDDMDESNVWPGGLH